MPACQDANHLQAAGAASHACCRHPAPRCTSPAGPRTCLDPIQAWGGDGRTDAVHTRATCTPVQCAHPRLPPPHFAPPRRHYCTSPCLLVAASPMSSGVRTLSPRMVSALPCPPSKELRGHGPPTPLRPSGGAALLGTPPPCPHPPRLIGDRGCHVLLKSIQGRALPWPPCPSKRVPSPSPPSKGEPCFPPAAEGGGGPPQSLPEPPTCPSPPAPWVPRQDLGFQLLNAKWSLGCSRVPSWRSIATHEATQTPQGWAPRGCHTRSPVPAPPELAPQQTSG